MIGKIKFNRKIICWYFQFLSEFQRYAITLNFRETEDIKLAYRFFK